jgi:AAHS family 3-hydroxyphenylpropionic acid transporter
MDATIQRVARPGLVVFTCFLIAAMEGYDLQAYGVAAQSLAHVFGLSPARVGWLGGMAMLGVVLGALVGGRFADRIGRKPVLLASVLVFGIFSIGTGLAGSTTTLFLTRLVAGVGFGGAMPNLIAIATEVTEQRRQASTVTLVFCGMPAGGAMVALLSRLAGTAIDWHAIFYIGGILPLLLVPLIAMALPETRPQQAVERSGAWRMLFGHGRAATTLLLWTGYLLTLLILYLLLTWLKSLVIAKGMDAALADTATFSFNLTSIVGSVAIGFLIDRFGTRWPLVLCYLGLAAALAGLGAAAAPDTIIILAGLVGFLVIGGQYSLYALPPRYYGRHERAAGAGAAVGVGRIGSVIGPVLGGLLRDAGFTPGAVLTALVPVALVAGVAVFALSFRPHVEHADEGHPHGGHAHGGH